MLVGSCSGASMMIYFKNRDIIIFLVFVDYILVNGNNVVLIKDLITKLNDELSLKELIYLGFFLGIKVTITQDIIHLSQLR